MFHVLKLVCLLALCHGFQAANHGRAQLKDAVSLGSPKLSGSRIAAGWPTTIKKHPHLVSLQHESEKDPNVQIHFCNGGIINKDWIVTTAHCILLPASGFRRGKNCLAVNARDWKRGNITVRVGSEYSDRDGVVYGVEKTITHELIIWEEDDYDIAVIKLNGSLVFSDVVQPITLPVFNAEVPAGTIFTIASWGSNYYGGDMNIELQEISLPIISRESCIEAMGGVVTISERMLCSFRTINEGMCDGDGGTPALVDGVMIGIASYTWACSSTTFPTVLTYASKYVEWINEHTGSAVSA